MQIPSANLLLPLSTGTTREPLLQQLTPGQILQGTALSENINGRLSLQIGVARLIAQTQLSVRPGQQLTLQVVKTDSLPELRVLVITSYSIHYTKLYDDWRCPYSEALRMQGKRAAKRNHC